MDLARLNALKARVKRRLKHALYKPNPPKLDQRLAALPRVFKSPPLTWSLTNAIHLISPHCDFRPTEQNRGTWEADQNGACWAEYEALEPTLKTIRGRILEIGPGLGRSLVFFSKKLGWDRYELHAYEGNGTTTQYTLNGPRFETSWCGTISELKNVLTYNGIHNVTIHDANKIKMRDLPGPFDLVFGFYNIGYHWSLEHFMPEINKLIGNHGIGIFTVPRGFQPFAELKTVPHRIVAKGSVIPDTDSSGGLLILGPMQREN